MTATNSTPKRVIRRSIPRSQRKRTFENLPLKSVLHNPKSKEKYVTKSQFSPTAGLGPTRQTIKINSRDKNDNTQGGKMLYKAPHGVRECP